MDILKPSAREIVYQLGFNQGFERLPGEKLVKKGRAEKLFPENRLTKLLKTSKLNKKLYPSYVEWNDYLVPAELAGKLNEEIK